MTDTALFAESAKDFLSRDEVTSISGLDYMQRIIDGSAPHPTVAKLMNFRVIAAEYGKVTFRAFPEHAQTNAFGSTQGGWYGMVLDSCMSMAVISGLRKGQFQSTIEYKINLIRAIPPGAELTITGELTHIGRSTGVAVGEIRGTQDGKLYGQGSCTCFIQGSPQDDAGRS
ncbi:PaaI family thioesterase [Thioclava sp. GXIMD4216]|uniref:PaaI family thioesterase n=1 Tax=Thioclava litoralis TaxID=3076557 RepID=A0ABZ1DYQ3_9RHOB|nr:PaaI family thioesterase [Thioclava sp. FTW29]